MRGTTVSLALFGLALAAPATPESQPAELQARQSDFKIGGPSTGFGVSNPGECNQEVFEQTGFCVIGGRITTPPKKMMMAKRQADFDLPADRNANLKEAIKEAQLELQRLQAKKHRTREEEKQIKALKFFVEKTSGVTKISPPSGGSTVLLPGRRSRSLLDRRQSRSGNPCLVDLEKYQRELQDFLLSFPPWERARIWAQLIQGVCGIQTGPITPDPTTPGAPIRPDPSKPGAPLRPDPAQPGAPLKPGSTEGEAA